MKEKIFNNSEMADGVLGCAQHSDVLSWPRERKHVSALACHPGLDRMGVVACEKRKSRMLELIARRHSFLIASRKGSE
jgi:hypothetical protein